MRVAGLSLPPPLRATLVPRARTHTHTCTPLRTRCTHIDAAPTDSALSRMRAVHRSWMPSPPAKCGNRLRFGWASVRAPFKSGFRIGALPILRSLTLVCMHLRGIAVCGMVRREAPGASPPRPRTWAATTARSHAPDRYQIACTDTYPRTVSLRPRIRMHVLTFVCMRACRRQKGKALRKRQGSDGIGPHLALRHLPRLRSLAEVPGALTGAAAQAPPVAASTGAMPAHAFAALAGGSAVGGGVVPIAGVPIAHTLAAVPGMPGMPDAWSGAWSGAWPGVSGMPGMMPRVPVAPVLGAAPTLRGMPGSPSAFGCVLRPTAPSKEMHEIEDPGAPAAAGAQGVGMSMCAAAASMPSSICDDATPSVGAPHSAVAGDASAVEGAADVAGAPGAAPGSVGSAVVGKRGRGEGPANGVGGCEQAVGSQGEAHGDSDDDDAPAAAQVEPAVEHLAKKPRQNFSWRQVALLETVYEVDARPVAVVRRQIAARIGVEPRAVQIWFQNRRQKGKVQGQARGGDDAATLPRHLSKAATQRIRSLEEALSSAHYSAHYSAVQIQSTPAPTRCLLQAELGPAAPMAMAPTIPYVPRATSATGQLASSLPSSWSTPAPLLPTNEAVAVSATPLMPTQAHGTGTSLAAVAAHAVCYPQPVGSATSLRSAIPIPMVPMAPMPVISSVSPPTGNPNLAAATNAGHGAGHTNPLLVVGSPARSPASPAPTCASTPTPRPTCASTASGRSSMAPAASTVASSIPAWSTEHPAPRYTAGEACSMSRREVSLELAAAGGGAAATTELPLPGSANVCDVICDSVPHSETLTTTALSTEGPYWDLPVSDLPVSDLPDSDLPVSDLPDSDLPVSDLPDSAARGPPTPAPSLDGCGLTYPMDGAWTQSRMVVEQVAVAEQVAAAAAAAARVHATTRVAAHAHAGLDAGRLPVTAESVHAQPLTAVGDVPHENVDIELIGSAGVQAALARIKF